MDFNDHYNRGVEFYGKKDYKSAITEFKAAHNLKPDNDANIPEIIRMLEMKINLQEQNSQAVVEEAKHRAAVLGIKVEDVDKAVNNPSVGRQTCS